MTNPTVQAVNGIVETWFRSAYTYAFTSALFRVWIMLMENLRWPKYSVIKESLKTA